MKRIRLQTYVLLIVTLLLGLVSMANAESQDKIKKTDTEFNLYTGMFDFSDDGKRSTLFGFEHQDEELFRDTAIGRVSPITGGFFTQAGATYLYSGVQAEYEIGRLNITPSFTPGYYDAGDGKDLGHALEFKSEVQLSFDLFKNSNLGMSYNHISNASLGKNNPGANSYMFNFLQKF